MVAGAGIAARITDAEPVTLALMQALFGYTSERRWLRHVDARMTCMFAALPGQSGYNKRLRKLAGTMQAVLAYLSAETGLRTDDVCVADSTPVECGRSRETALRSELGVFAEYGSSASHSRYF